MSKVETSTGKRSYNDVIWRERWKYCTENLNMNMHKLLKVKHPDTDGKYMCYIEELHKN